ncbi:hypothetical protein [Mucilaginibacter rubeus]|uniref:Uncharacterized protein n=1 Tax=Mucilaginibacter rubeus TaxID=2027860 RepID=A0A5C1I082_9SPHI|nr:hypothetical protein [Mucilaginibacter rubeus]QEM10608.1 hypothetical protein DEO27_011450 [Mucilaginibacter rubeus]
MRGSTHDKLVVVWSEKIRVFETDFNEYWSELYRHAYRKTQTRDVSKDLAPLINITPANVNPDFASLISAC